QEGVLLGNGLGKTTGEPLAIIPTEYSLEQNYPNPFNPTTVINYQLPVVSNVKLVIYNTLGQQVRTLVSGSQNAGSYTVQWDGRNDTGQKVASGMYLYRITAGSFVQTRKMMLMK
ncbi:MAG: T9SS type A sorting domain-containing protein, partial [Calditrichaeota bacterium]|nr:T9SS type A sorting domain-containing protein [Calditrichota bacterium]